jgi:branched-subunit amino acid transport protein AzlD
MFSLIGKVLEEHSFAMILVLVLLIILTNAKSMEKVMEHGMKRIVIVAIILYYLSIMIKVLFSIICGTG